MKKMNRRDFLKLTGLVSAGTALTALRPSGGSLENKKSNIVILVADAMSADNLSLYGYSRHTTPNLERLAERALVYHSHYSGGNFTTSGTASMLTGMYPWTHRAINMGGLVRRPLADRNIFHLLGMEYYRVGYCQNFWADLFVRQFGADVDQHIPSANFIFRQKKPHISQNFKNDQLSAYYAIDDFLFSTQHVLNPRSGSVSMGYLGLFYELRTQDLGQVDEEHPYGIPSNGYYYFKNHDVYNGILQKILDLHQEHSPFFAYYHLMAPHSVYCPTREFVDSLEEMSFPTKQYHPLGGRARRKELLELRKKYDEYVANVDSEMGRLLDALEDARVLEDTYFIITSDHGEFFERGEFGHDTPLLFNPVIHIPLIVFKPGQTKRQDFHIPTSSTDLVPTLLSLAGRSIPSELEGGILPGLGGDVGEPGRPVFAVEAKTGSSFRPLSRASMTMIKGTNKIIHYMGFEKYPDAFELFDLSGDAEERRDLYSLDTVTAKRMKEELLDHYYRAEHRFQNK